MREIYANGEIGMNNTILGLAILATSAAVLMVFGSSIGFWEPIVGFGASRKYNDYLGAFVTVISFAALFYNIKYINIGTLKLLLSLLLGLAILSPTIMNFFVSPVRYPAIHDITTNIDNPPAFTFLDETRPGAKNSLIYGGVEVAVEQLKGYPTIKPIVTVLPADEAYKKAISIATSMGWTLVKEYPDLFRFESTARTPFFNFADDVVVVITALEEGSRIDIRSVSRIGRGDRGVNAQRVLAFINHFDQ